MRRFSLLLFLICFLWTEGAAKKKSFAHVPGTVVAYSPASSGVYIGSPSLVVLPNGHYLAAHDLFGPETEPYQGITVIYLSKDSGKTWKKLSEIRGATWSTLFVHRDALYLMGPDRPHGTVFIRKSTDNGKTWSVPTNRSNGILVGGGFHCAPSAVVEYNGRLWRPMEAFCGPDLRWGKCYGAMMMSASVNADLLKSGSWRLSNILPFDPTYLDGTFGGWLEGNFVVDPQGGMWNIMRVHNTKPDAQEHMAMISVMDAGKRISFDSETGFIPFAGGGKRFKINFDPVSKHYWTLANPILPKYRKGDPKRNNAAFRNVLTLYKSADLMTWDEVSVILEDENVKKTGFQYVDWLFEGDDLILLSRTACFDGENDADNYHNSNFLTFHRILNFRNLQH